MAIEKLKEILNYSEELIQLYNWDEVESDIGISLPNDYKQFVESFGCVQIDEFLLILTPFEKDEFKNLKNRITINIETRKILSEQFDQLSPYPVFPLENSLLQFGLTDNGDELFWKINKSPEKWKIVVNESRSPEFQEFELSFVEFLEKLLTREISCSAFPSDFPLLEHSYRMT